MSLIICPECKKEISSFANTCPNCGFPLEQKNINSIYDLILISIGDSKMEIIKLLRQNRTLNLGEALSLVTNTPSVIFSNIKHERAIQLKKSLELLGAIIEINESNNNKNNYFEIKYDGKEIECPRCHSSAVTTGNRGFSLVWGFIGSGKTVNMCGKCGYSWKP